MRASPAAVAGAAGLACGAVGLVGWALDIAPLKSILPGLSTMKANTAFCLVLTGGATVALAHNPAPGRRRRAAGVGAAVAGLLGVLTLLQYATGADLGID